MVGLGGHRLRQCSLTTPESTADARLRAYPARASAVAIRQAITPQASWSRARWFWGFFDQRTSRPRNRFSHEWVRSTGPAAGAEVGILPERFLLLAAGADVRGEAELVGERVHLRVVVALVQAEARPRPLRGVRSLDQDAFEGRAEELEVVDVRAGDLEPDREARTVADDRSFRPLFALSVGFGPVAAPPSGALPIAPSQDSHSHSIPCSSS